MSEITIAKQKYRTGKLDAMQQFHIARRLAPILATMGISLRQLASGSNMSVDDFLPVLGPVSEILAHMTDADADYIIFSCLATVQREQGNSWAPVVNGKSLMFQDLDLPGMMRLVIEVLKDNLGDFLTGLGDDANSPSS